MGVVDEVKARLDIVELVSESVPLQKAGRNYRALCPFHSEKAPSFYVFTERQTWHCFGACATGGDIFAFVMKKENLDFGEALKLLAQRAGVVLAPPTPERKAEEEKSDRLYQVNEAAAQYYHHCLLNSSAAATARDYVHKRGLEAKTVEDFRLGYSPVGGRALEAYLLERGYTAAEMLAVGLTVERDSGERVDRFQNRLMFPITTAQGRVAGFGARALDESLPKYLNTPQTEIFDKGGLLYGLDRAKAAIRHLGQVVIVEGYMDVIMAHQFGFANVVASMGTSITERQVAQLKKLTRNFILALDADAAGTEATMRAREVAGRALDQKTIPIPGPGGLVRYENVLDAEIRVLLLPPGRDPDEVIREGRETWQKLIDQALPLVDYIIEQVASRLDLSRASEKSAAARQLLPLLAEINEPVRRAHYLQRLARLIKVEESVLTASLRRLGASRLKTKEVEQKEMPSLASGEPAEEYCLSLLLQQPELRSQTVGLLPEYFDNIENREIFRTWQGSAQGTIVEGEVASVLLPRLEFLKNKTLVPLSPREREQALSDTIGTLKEKYLRRVWAAQEELLEAAQTEEQISRLQEQGLEPSAELREIFQKRRQKARLGE